MSSEQSNIIIYNTADGKTSVSLLSKDFLEKELSENSVVKEYLTTAKIES